MNTGDIVRSKAGHDKGEAFIIVGKEGNYFLLCDGKSKLLSSPKRKNGRHLEKIGYTVDISRYNPLYDAHIRKELKRTKEVCK